MQRIRPLQQRILPLTSLRWTSPQSPGVSFYSTSQPCCQDDKQSTRRFVPEPSWSVKDLELTAQHDKLPPDELARLAHRALLDVTQLPDLDQDLANMMHMVQQVSNVVKGDEDGSIYDHVRGVHAAPLRSSTDDALQEEDQIVADQVWESYLKPNTMRLGGSHSYFSISTKLEQQEGKDEGNEKR